MGSNARKVVQPALVELLSKYSPPANADEGVRAAFAQ
jgi:hypothetical protein